MQCYSMVYVPVVFFVVFEELFFVTLFVLFSLL